MLGTDICDVVYLLIKASVKCQNTKIGKSRKYWYMYNVHPLREM